MEHQLSWFGKQYCVENDITLCGKTNAEALFTDFLDSYVERKMRINKAEKEQFRKEFVKLCDNAFGREEKNQERIYDKDKMNKILKEQKLGYEIQSTSDGWEVVSAYMDLETEK